MTYLTAQKITGQYLVQSYHISYSALFRDVLDIGLQAAQTNARIIILGIQKWAPLEIKLFSRKCLTAP